MRPDANGRLPSPFPDCELPQSADPEALTATSSTHNILDNAQHARQLPTGGGKRHREKLAVGFERLHAALQRAPVDDDDDGDDQIDTGGDELAQQQPLKDDQLRKQAAAAAATGSIPNTGRTASGKVAKPAAKINKAGVLDAARKKILMLLAEQKALVKEKEALVENRRSKVRRRSEEFEFEAIDLSRGWLSAG
ncbi:hypothetical protein N0V88_000708 [Collariella sp. IMI 366227]|nr:hypothetical protein N0V88_000708 [Collariella sp. IMI 366227]